MKRTKTIILRVLFFNASIILISFGIFIMYFEYSVKVCDDLLMEKEHIFFIIAYPDNEVELFNLYRIFEENLVESVVFETREEVLADFKVIHATDQNILAALNELGENPFGARINITIQLKNINNVDLFIEYIDSIIAENASSSVIDYSTNFSILKYYTPSSVKERIKTNTQSLFWKIDYIKQCKSL